MLSHCQAHYYMFMLSCVFCIQSYCLSVCLSVSFCRLDFHSSPPRADQYSLCFFRRCGQLSEQHRGLDDVCEVQGAAHGHQLHHHQPRLHRHRRGRHWLPHVSCLRPPRQLEIWLHRLSGGWGIKHSHHIVSQQLFGYFVAITLCLLFCHS